MARPDRFLNRELSWLDFADRLVDLAADESLPLLERVKFIAILSSGLDEFFQVRVGGLKDHVAAGLRARSADGRSAAQQLQDIRSKCIRLLQRSDEVFESSIVPSLARAGLYFASIEELDTAERAGLLSVFEKEIFPVLTPLAVDPGHPFPYISNLSLNLAVLVEDPSTREQRFARVKVPPLLPRFVPLDGGGRFVALEQLIAANLPRLFPHMEIGRHHAFRVTRNADLDLEESEADDLLAAVETELRRRRFGRAVRLEVDRDMPPAVRDLLLEELELGPDEVYENSAPLGLSQLWALHAIDRPDLHEPTWVPMTQPRLATAGDGPVDLFAVLRERRCARAPPLRLVHDLGGGVHNPGRRRPERPRHQADPLPHLRRHAPSSRRSSGRPSRASRSRPSSR